MAVLAAGGIGVFGSHHVVVDATGKCHLVKNISTHDFAWLALEHWAGSTAAGDVVLTSIQPGAIALHDWLSVFSAGPGYQGLVAKQWLLAWGLDLKRFTEDRVARNQASYRPTAFASPRAAALTDVLSFVSELWRLNEPLGTLAFARLDRHLLRSCLGEAFKAAKGRSSRQAPNWFSSDVAALLGNLPAQPVGLSIPQWQELLCHQNGTPVLLREALRKGGPSVPTQPLQVMARAALMLRLASGAVQAGLLILPNPDIAELAFWWSSMGEDRCLWGQGQAPPSFSDLWADIGDALDDLEDWRAQPGNHNPSYSALWQEMPRPAACLASCERMALWGLDL